jgi:hypothetical protein
VSSDWPAALPHQVEYDIDPMSGRGNAERLLTPQGPTKGAGGLPSRRLSGKRVADSGSDSPFVICAHHGPTHTREDCRNSPMGRALLVLLDPHAIRHIRWRAKNHVITCLQSRTNVDAGSIVCIEIDLVKLDLPLRNDCCP